MRLKDILSKKTASLGAGALLTLAGFGCAPGTDIPDEIDINVNASGGIDVAVSRNALDHLDDLAAAVDEIHRILHPGGEIVLSVNYQETATRCEPQVIDDALLGRLFEGRFAHEIVQRFEKGHDSGIGTGGRFVYPHEIVTVRGRRV